MKKLFSIILVVSTFSFANDAFTQNIELQIEIPSYNNVVFANLCKPCNSICVTFTGSSFSDVACTGPYGSSVGWADVPGGNYTVQANCVSGISLHWETTIFIKDPYSGTQGTSFKCTNYESTTTTRPRTTTIPTPSLPCMFVEIYGVDSEEAELLRYFRDNVLSQTPEGQELIKLYYQWSPVIVKAMEGDEEFKEEMKEMIDGILPIIKTFSY